MRKVRAAVVRNRNSAQPKNPAAPIRLFSLFGRPKKTGQTFRRFEGKK